ncbi:hypothetical protein FQB35_14915 [Crassaminicella thermophila]|uniref:Uncharacterized protein n=1 Tax=Crassaminicella thermophila TaxID=2599308 RepID=A0A5C0SKI0_CRATE|nr:YkuS family protein [Crassaminicella thermophila]QEK13449.1 hypothetical protein FQB35_14915 [Crassaminicella thermophila]
MLTISVQNDLHLIREALEIRGHNIANEMNQDTSIYIVSNIDEDWEQMKSLEWICLSKEKCVLIINASKLSVEKILEKIDHIAKKQAVC